MKGNENKPALLRSGDLSKRILGTDYCRCRQNCRQDPLFVVENTSMLSGGPSGARTHDTLLKSSTFDSLNYHFNRGDIVVYVATIQHLLVAVAVKVAVKCHSVIRRLDTTPSPRSRRSPP